MHKHLESASLHPHFFHSHTLILELRCENKHPHSFGLKSTVINTGNSSVVQAWTQTFLFSHISLHIKKHKCTSDQFESRISVHLLSHFFTWLPLFTYSNNSKGTVSQRLWQHELSTLTSSLKRSWRLISERSRHCFCSCSSSESGCLKYSIRSFSVCSTSSTKLATSVDPPSAMLSRALRGKAHLWDYSRGADEHHCVPRGRLCEYLIKLVKRKVVLRMIRAARDSSCWQRCRIRPSSMCPSECRQA